MGLSDDQQKQESSVTTPPAPIVYPNVETDSSSQTYYTYTGQSDQGSSSSGHATGTANPYITTSAAGQNFGGRTDVINDNLSKWRKKAEEVAKKAEEAAGNVWQHWKTGPNMAETVWGRLSQGTRLLTEGSYDKIFRQTFETAPDEQLQKSYACYLSTSSGPVAGTLYISTKRVAFCSDRPLSYEPSPGQKAWSYYKTPQFGVGADCLSEITVSIESFISSLAIWFYLWYTFSQGGGYIFHGVCRLYRLYTESIVHAEKIEITNHAKQCHHIIGHLKRDCPEACH